MSGTGTAIDVFRAGRPCAVLGVTLHPLQKSAFLLAVY